MADIPLVSSAPGLVRASADALYLPKINPALTKGLLDISAGNTTDGKGVLFPAASSGYFPGNDRLVASEFGSLTLGLSRDASASNLTFNSQNASYYRIGYCVFIKAFWHISSVNTQGTGNNIVTGLPFAWVNVNSGCITNGSNFNGTLACQTLVQNIGANPTGYWITQGVSLVASGWVANTDIFWTGWYHCA